jgi:hypothetical protein
MVLIVASSLSGGEITSGQNKSAGLSRQSVSRRLVAEALADELLAIARSLVANEQRPFGAAEFQLRDLLLQAGAKALEVSLAQKKKTATRAPA